MSKLRRLLAALTVLLFVPTARADVYTPFYGTRSMSMGGAHRGIGTSNDTLFVNPAGMASSRRYSADLEFATGKDHIHRLQLSTVDSKTAALAAGLAYTRMWGNPSGAHPQLGNVVFGLAYSPLSVLAIGLSAQNISGHITEDGVRHKLNIFNGTFGAMLTIAQIIGLGFSWENFVKMHQPTLLPQALGFGAGLRTALVNVAVDLRLFPGKQLHHKRDLGVGGEFLIAKFLSLRSGYRLSFKPVESGSRKQHWLGFGAGVATGSMAIDAGMEKSLHSRDWRFSTNVQFGM